MDPYLAAAVSGNTEEMERLDDGSDRFDIVGPVLEAGQYQVIEYLLREKNDIVLLQEIAEHSLKSGDTRALEIADREYWGEAGCLPEEDLLPVFLSDNVTSFRWLDSHPNGYISQHSDGDIARLIVKHRASSILHYFLSRKETSVEEFRKGLKPKDEEGWLLESLFLDSSANGRYLYEALC